MTIKEESKFIYAIIRHNVRTYESGGVVEVIQGKQHAEMSLKLHQESESSETHQAGWRYFLEKTTIKPGTGAVEATQQRQKELDVRESEAL